MELVKTDVEEEFTFEISLRVFLLFGTYTQRFSVTAKKGVSKFDGRIS